MPSSDSWQRCSSETSGCTTRSSRWKGSYWPSSSCFFRYALSTMWLWRREAVQDTKYASQNLLESYAFYLVAGIGALPAALFYAWLSSHPANAATLVGTVICGLVLAVLAWFA